jgi:PAS domain S-box-containing protein
MFGLFAAFIFACGSTHLIGLWTIWQPVYWLDATVRLVTAGVSIGTAVALWPMIPKALKLPSPRELEDTNALLRKEVEQRQQAESRLQELNRHLERRVAERTAELTAANATLSEERNTLRTLIDTLPDIVFAKDASGRYVMCNDTAVKYQGYAKEAEVLGKTVFDIYPRELAQAAHEDDLKALSGQAVLNREEHVVARDGSQRWILTIKVPLRSPGGEVRGLIGISRDITERRRSEELLRRAQRLESIGTLAGGIAHDFNNILSAIIGNLRLAREAIPASSTAQGALEVALAASRRASELVKRILSFSRPEESRRETMQLQPVVEEALKLLRSTTPAMIQIEAAIKAPLPAVSADAGQIHQLIVNLVTNSVRAIGEKTGTVRVGLDSLVVDARQVTMGMYPELREGAYVCLSVVDNGCGMDERTRERIFDPFFTTQSGGRGTGLGLSIVHAIVQSHQGAVAVSSEVGKGTTFRAYFPAANSAARRLVTDESLVKPASTRGGRILYVDDEASLVALGKKYLERYGYHVTVFTDPVQALDAFKSNPGAFDAVVTDFSMPVLSGVDLAWEIRGMRPDMPIVLITGFLQAEDSEAIRAVGLSHILTKPDHLDGLGRALDAAMGTARE